jgi:hypothetical protein
VDCLGVAAGGFVSSGVQNSPLPTSPQQLDASNLVLEFGAATDQSQAGCLLSDTNVEKVMTNRLWRTSITTLALFLSCTCIVRAQTPPASGAAAVTGVLNVLNYGAKCDGRSDDTKAIQAVINLVRNSKNGHTILIPGTAPCVVTQLDFTNIEHRLRLIGESSFAGLHSTILCHEPASNNDVCLDFSGAGHISIENLRFNGGTSISDAPRIVVLMGKTVASAAVGNGSETSWHQVTIEGYGDYQVYNYGGEVWGCTDCYLANLSPTGNTGKAVLVFSSNNTAGIVSPFAKLRPAPVSMTTVHFSGGATTFGVQGTSVGILFDPSRSGIADIGFADGYAHVSGPAFISEEPSAAGTVQGLRITGWRLEAYTPSTLFAEFSNVVQQLHIDAVYANPAQPTVAPLQFNRKTAFALSAADIMLRPNDSQANYPSVVVYCASDTVGVTIHDFVARGGAPQGNDCPGATEIFHGVYNGCSGTTNLSGGRATVQNRCIVGSRPIICTDNSSTSGAGCSAVPIRGGVALYGNGSDKVSWAQQ